MTKKKIIKYNNKFYLIDRRCPHNGLPLTSASFINNYITCRWHGCRFSFIPDSATPGRFPSPAIITIIKDLTV